jgi:predicted metal-binding protein
VESPTVPVSLDELNEQKAGLVFVCSSNRQVKSSLSEVREAVDAVESLGKQVNSEKQTKIADKTIISCVESLLTCFSFFLTHYISI